MSKSVAGANSVIHGQGIKKQGCCRRHGVKILFVVGLILLVAGVICAITNVFEDWMEDEIKENVVLTEGNDVYDKWLVPETPTYVTYYIFNVSNAEEVSKGGVPNLQQRGPYTYRIDPSKTVLSRNNYTSSSITYLIEKHRFFVKELSCESCDPTRDSVTNVNLPFLSTIEMIIKYIKSKDPKSLPFVLNVMDDIFVKLNLQDFHTLTVHELLWGYEDAALSKAYDILIRLAKSRDPTLNITLPKMFALQKNKTVSLYTIDSGDDNVDNVGKFLLWNNKPNITCWSDKYANMINGSDGVHYRPFISKDDVIYALVTAVYRSFRLIYDSTVYYRGIRLYRFALAEDQFISGDINGNNRGFCVTGKKKKCLPSGVMDLSYCDPSGAPLVGSLPHFYLGSKSLLNTVNGLNPQKYVHGTFLDIEPHTGITMQGNRRIQINANLRDIEGISAFKKTSTVYLPILFVNKNGRISEDDADDFKNDVLLPLRFCQAAPFILFGLGAIALLLAGIISYNRYRKRDAISDEKIPLVLSSSKSYTEPT